MTILPSISELGLFGLEKRYSPYESPEPSPVLSPVFSNPFSISVSSWRDDSSSAAGSFRCQVSERKYQKDVTYQLPNISSLVPASSKEYYSFNNGHFGASAPTRRGSAESTCSTPSLAGSVSTCVTTGTDRSLSPVVINHYSKFQDLPLNLAGFDSRALKSSKFARRGSPPALTIPSRTSSVYSLPAHTPSSPKSRSHPGTTPQTVPMGRLVSSLTRPRAIQKRRKPQKQEGEGHCNIKYSDEQHHFLIYCHDDLNMTWDQIKDAYSKQFPGGPKRDVAGVQSIHYRINAECPMRTEDNLLVFGEPEVDADGHKKRDANGKVPKFNQYDNMVFKALIRTTGKVSLIDRYAEQVAEYNWSWVKPEDMERARTLAAKRRPYRLEWDARKQAKKAAYNGQAYESNL